MSQIQRNSNSQMRKSKNRKALNNLNLNNTMLDRQDHKKRQNKSQAKSTKESQLKREKQEKRNLKDQKKRNTGEVLLMTWQNNLKGHSQTIKVMIQTINYCNRAKIKKLRNISKKIMVLDHKKEFKL